MTTQRQFDDVRFLSHHDEWPCFPACPVKRYDGKDRGGFPTCGIVWACKPTVLVVNMFGISGCNYEGAKAKAEEVIEYESFDAMVADGWIVD